MKNCNKLIERYADIADGDDLVSNFYKDTVVFITGGTGFIGKLLIEKLLRVFSIKRIYLLVRPKNNMTADVRLEKFFEESVRMIIIAHPKHFAVILHLLLFFSNIRPHRRGAFGSPVLFIFHILVTNNNGFCLHWECMCVLFFAQICFAVCFFFLLHSRFLIDCEKNHQT